VFFDLKSIVDIEISLLRCLQASIIVCALITSVCIYMCMTCLGCRQPLLVKFADGGTKKKKAFGSGQPWIDRVHDVRY